MDIVLVRRLGRPPVNPQRRAWACHAGTVAGERVADDAAAGQAGCESEGDDRAH